jgi:hypothetical protein
MIVHNISKGKDNYSQRNNKVRPFSSCNTTSLTMATSYIDGLWSMFINSPYFLKYKYFEQPEDRLQQALLDWGLEPTNHYQLMEGYNRFIGLEIDSFSLSAPFRDLIGLILEGRPWVGSGDFPGYPKINIDSKTGKPKPLGHIVCIVGMVYETDPYSPSAMIIDDPYGDTMNNWQGSGNDEKIPIDLFVNWMKPLKVPNKFWAHIFRKIF